MRTEATGPAIDELLKELSKTCVKTRFLLRISTEPSAPIVGIASLWNWRNQSIRPEPGAPAAREWTAPRLLGQVSADVTAVTAEEVERMANRNLPVDNLELIAVGDAGKMPVCWRRHGPDEKYSAEGKSSTDGVDAGRRAFLRSRCLAMLTFCRLSLQNKEPEWRRAPERLIWQSNGKWGICSQDRLWGLLSQPKCSCRQREGGLDHKCGSKAQSRISQKNAISSDHF